MCGRFALFSSPARIKNHFATSNELMLEPRFNIAPTQTVPVIKTDQTGKRILTLARWGLIPSWVDDPEEMQQPINAKAETAAIKPMFRHAYRSSRVLVPADAFYEWSARDGKQPFLVKMKDEMALESQASRPKCRPRQIGKESAAAGTCPCILTKKRYCLSAFSALALFPSSINSLTL